MAKSTSTNKTFSTGVTKRGTIDTGKYSSGGSTVLKSSSGSSYDFATGERGANNKYTADQVTQINGGTIDASKLGQSQITLPETPKTQNQNGTIAGANASLVNPGIGLTTDKNGLLVYNPVTPDATNATTPAVSNFQSYMNAIAGVEKPSATDTYERLYKESGLKKASQDVQNYTSQINTIVAKSQADQLAVAGQGRGIPEPIIGGQQAQISKEAAIQALPLQALLANAQGNKELAQQHLDTAYKLEMQDAQSNYEYKTKVLDSVYNFATAQEKTKLEDVRRKEDQAFELKKMGIANDYAIKLKSLDNKTAASPQEQARKSLDQFSFLKETIKDANDLSGKAGPNLITQGIGNFFVGNTGVKQLANKLDTLKVNLLTLNTDPAVKKFFGPQMTEKDTQLLMAAGTTLDAYANTPDGIKKELKRYGDLINRMETAVKNGGAVSEKVVTAPDGNIIQIID